MGDWLLVFSICLVSALFAIIWLYPVRAGRGFANRRLFPSLNRDPVYLFDGPDLIGQSETGTARNETAIFDWDGLRRKLANEFPSFPDSPDQVKRLGEISVPAIDGKPGRDVLCEWVDGVIRVELRDGGKSRRPGPEQAEANDPIRRAMDRAPYPVWFLDDQNHVRWGNSAYVDLAHKVRGQNPRLNNPLFREAAEKGAAGKKQRVAIKTEDDAHTLWFDLSLVKQEDGTLCYAVDINAVVDAEVAQRNFVQTLAKTFAQLSIGLAIFDRNRQLALFNPALIDLTALPADFLSGRPSVSSFFDRLRNQNMMPEPKNYGGWRQQMNDLIQAAADGRYQETWTLPSGSVYSVSGRPHPDGAVAFLFEDITAEITLTRRFRSEIEIGQSILDRLEDAIAVFSPDGTLALSNTAYQTLWQVDPDNSFAQITILDAVKTWQKGCAPTPVLGEIRDTIELRQNRDDWTANLPLRNGKSLTCTISPVQNGSTMVRFSAIAPIALCRAVEATTL